MSTEEMKRLTVSDPVDGETLGKLNELEGARLQLGGQLLDLKQEEIKILAAAHRLDEQRGRVFEKILMDRGLPPNAIAEIDAGTGKLVIHNRVNGAAPTPQASQPEPESTITA